MLEILSADLVPMSKNWRYRSTRTFFGLTNEYMENIYEQFFLLKHHGGWSLFELYNLPVGLRKWFLERMIEEFEKEKKEIEKARRK